MRYIGRYKEGVDFQDLVARHPILSNVTHLQYVYMFVIETDDAQVLNQLRSDNDILYVQEDRLVQGTDIIEDLETQEVEHWDKVQYPYSNMAKTIDNSTGYNVPTTALTTFTGITYYYWHLEHINKRDLTQNHTYHTYSYSQDGNGVDVYVVDSGVSKVHTHLLDAGSNTRVFGVPGFGGDDGVTGVKITAGGTGYTTGQAVSFSGGGGTSAAGTIRTTSGVITGVNITNFGSGYTSAPSVTFPAGGAGGTGTVTIGNDDDNHHGTHCALCIGGNGRGGAGLYGPGVAKEAKIYAVKVLDYAGSGYSSTIASGINAIIAHNTSTDTNYKGNSRPSVINYSIGHNIPNSIDPRVYEDITGSRSDTADITEDVLKIATTPGVGNTQEIHVVQSAGNGFSNDNGSEFHGPMQAKYNVGMIARTTAESGNTDSGQGVPICVGATNEFNTSSMTHTMAYFSNYGKTAVSIMAPGKSVVVPHWEWYLGGANNVYQLISGTSFSSPIVAGLVALRLGHKPTETPANLKTWLINTTSGGATPDIIQQLLTPTTLALNPITTTASSSTVSVSWPGHTLTTGNKVQINGSSPVGGISASNINGWQTVTGTSANSFTFTSSTASSTQSDGGSAVQTAKVTGTFEATDGVVDNGSTLQLVDNSSTQTAITYLPVSYTDNSFAYSPYQDWIITWSVAAGSLGTVAISSSINFTLSAGIATAVPEQPFPSTYTITSTPAGTSFNTSTGVLSGNPSSTGTHNFTVEVTNGYAIQTRNYSLSVINVATSIGGGITMSGGITVNS